MTRWLIILSLIVFSAGAAQAACYADYKAKKDSPLRLHYGVMQLDGAACANRNAAQRVVGQRLKRGGWTLLNVMQVFDQRGLEQRKASAGKFFLRY
ncbi:hypothetical protein [Ovoidimarina sediminis]|uniref:hypothetical protein n=1 Tax=Ovoidimarina sediminis TaxID=3079856 RepID=UPI002910C9EB|nr:hypothetical protein [Rhodophyticola sp. MJ-SS7]MDU8942567.1 hypothetical protein [Rhodophyticola sp. MJ-SS7]